MPPKHKSQGPRRYGRQAEGKTIKTLSLSADLAAWAEQEATAAGMSFSGWLQAQLQAAQMTRQTNFEPSPPALGSGHGTHEVRKTNVSALNAELSHGALAPLRSASGSSRLPPTPEK